MNISPHPFAIDCVIFQLHYNFPPGVQYQPKVCALSTQTDSILKEEHGVQCNRPWYHEDEEDEMTDAAERYHLHDAKYCQKFDLAIDIRK
jgi:hypothetical protein